MYQGITPCVTQAIVVTVIPVLLLHVTATAVSSYIILHAWLVRPCSGNL